MTLFEKPEDLPPVIDPTKNYLPDLVGEGKKFKTPEDLARGKAESDALIDRMKAEQAELRKELDTRLKYEEFLQRLEAAPKPSGSTPVEPTPSEPVVKGLTEEDVTKKVETVLVERETQRKFSDNLDYVKEQLSKSYGPDYAHKIAGQAKALGLSQKDVDGMAAQSPKAFLQLFGAPEKVQVKESMFTPRSEVNSTSFTPNTNVEKTAKYYRELKAKDPRAYHDPRIANEMHTQAVKLGELYFD